MRALWCSLLLCGKGSAAQMQLRDLSDGFSGPLCHLGCFALSHPPTSHGLLGERWGLPTLVHHGSFLVAQCFMPQLFVTMVRSLQGLHLISHLIRAPLQGRVVGLWGSVSCMPGQCHVVMLHQHSAASCGSLGKNS